jgi:hypothetical protein
MKIFLRAGGQLREKLKPDIDHYTRKVEFEGEKSIGEILKLIEINPSFIAFIYVNGQIKDLAYIPLDGQILTLQPPVSGG